MQTLPNILRNRTRRPFVALRQVRPDDAAALQGFVRALSRRRRAGCASMPR